MTQPGTSPASAAPSVGRVVLLYSTLRLLLFLALWLVVVLLGVPPLPGALAAAVLTSVLSLVLLRRQRAQVSAAVAARIERKRLEQEELRRRLDQGPAGHTGSHEP